MSAFANSVIAEGKYTLFDGLFSAEEERAFISSLGERSAIYVAEIDGEIGVFSRLICFPTSLTLSGTVRH
jgi:hypothetical protein